MSEKRYYWLKLYDTFFENKTSKYLRKLPDGDKILLVYLKLQLKLLKTEDGTHGTANWMNEKEMTEVLSFDKPGIILGKYNNKFVKLPFDSYFNKNICVFGSSGSMKTIRISLNKLT